MMGTSLQYLVSAREYELLRDLFAEKAPKNFKLEDRWALLRPPSSNHDYNAAAFRSSLRLFVAAKAGLKAFESLSARLRSTNAPQPDRPTQRGLARSTKLALSFSTFVFMHRILFGFLTRLRLRLLDEKAKKIRERYPWLFQALTANVAPAIGASLAGLAFGICPADQLRVTIAIFLAGRSLEALYNTSSAKGYFPNKPKWMASWMIFAVSQGQLFHAFVFDPDCVPQTYGNFILRYTPDFVSRRPLQLSSKVAWPNPNQIRASLAQIATLRWPPFISPILYPANKQPLPPLVDPIISPITSRAQPALQHLSCALLHPSEQSCFTAYLQQNLKAFSPMARFFTLYYGAFSVLKYRQFINKPLLSLNRLSAQILKTTVAIVGAISASWGSICLFQAILPRSFLPRFRFFLGGVLGGCFAVLDFGSTGDTNALYTARMSVDCLWKVGVKHGWWRGVRGGDVLLFTSAFALLNIICDYEGDKVVGQLRERYHFKLLRGQVELGMANTQKSSTTRQAGPEEDEHTKSQ